MQDSRTGEHIIFLCPRWTIHRNRMVSNIGETIIADNIIEIMLQNKNKWDVMHNIIEILKIIEEEGKNSCVRQDSSSNEYQKW